MIKTLEIRNLRAGYGDSEILKGVSLNVRSKEIVAIIGPNGSGKTTLLRSIFNQCSIYSGEIIFRGKIITRGVTHKLIREGISYIPQGRQVFGSMTVLENLEMGGFMFKNKTTVKENIDKVFFRFPFLKQSKNEYAFNLSGGQQQSLSIARALMQGSSLMLLDEPSLGLSPKMVSEIFEIIRELKSNGISVLLVEQNAKKAADNADRIYVLEHGEIVMEGSHELLNDRRLKDIYFGGE